MRILTIAFVMTLILTILVGGAYLFLIFTETAPTKAYLSTNIEAEEVSVKVKDIDDLSQLASQLESQNLPGYHRYIFIKCPGCNTNLDDIKECSPLLESKEQDASFLKSVASINMDINNINKIEKKYFNGVLHCFYYEYT